jgi:hypothetical protein
VRLASDFSPALDGSHLPQSTAALGIHVDSFVRHLSQLEVVDVVEGAVTNCSPGVALRSLSSGLAGDGRRCFLGCETTRTLALAHYLALGVVRNYTRRNSALGYGAIHSPRATASARVGRDVGSDHAPSLRYFPDSCSNVAEPFARRLAQGNSIRRGARSPYPALLFARGELSWAFRLARVAEHDWLIRF